MSLDESTLHRAQVGLSRRHVLRAALAAGASAAGLAACAGDEPAPTLAEAAANRAVAQGLVGAAFGWLEPGPRSAAPLLGLAGRREPGGAALQPGDALYVGSNGKAMSAMVIARLVEHGHLAWSDTVADRLPELAGTLRADYAGVTLAHWLDHLGGVVPLNGSTDDEQRFMAALAADPDPLPETSHGRRVYVAGWVLQQAPVEGVRPGQDFAYSNAGYLIAATMAEAATGQDFEVLLQTWLAQPLGLSLQGRPLSGPPAGAPQGHEGDSPGTLVRVEPLDALAETWWQTLAPAGQWACTPASYARWLDALLTALRGGASVLPGDAVARLRQLPAGGYALGWAAAPLPDGMALVHIGHVPGFMAEAAVDAAGRWAGFGLTNTGWEDADGGWVQALLNAQIVQMARQRGRLPR